LHFISEILENWYSKNRRDLPWRDKASPYHIWLSEIILQQTRVNQGLDYYRRFTGKYPTVVDLANAPLDEVLKLWQGLGYYGRARNLHATAREVVDKYQGNFPNNYEELLKLKGIGSYTAAAIASIAFKEPVALVDGNVYRVLSRLFGMQTPIDSPAGKKLFASKAAELLNPLKPDIHNQAIMEFGALVCLPKKPDCVNCMLANVCRANIEGLAGQLPVKEGRKTSRIRYLNYLHIHYKEYTFLNRRDGNDIWNSLYEFPLIETEQQSDADKLVTSQSWKSYFGNLQVHPHPHSRTYKHQLTHQTLYCTFHRITLDQLPDTPHFNFKQVLCEDLSTYAVPRIIDKYLTDILSMGD